MTRPVHAWGLLVVSWLLASTNSASADAVFVVKSVDGPGEGFNDPTPVAPIGGNEGATRGEQRRIAIEYAASLWGSVLNSSVEIIVRADFSDLGCDDSAGAVLASAAPASAAIGVSAQWSKPDLVYPSALADRIEETDIDPGRPDIAAHFNSGIDLPSCGLPVRWYYGLDGLNGTDVDLVQATLHELAHGLGIAPLLDANTGAYLADSADPFTALIFDRILGAHLNEVDDGDRMAALSHSRQVVFDGARTRADAEKLFVPGSPSLSFAPKVQGFSGFVADTNFSPVLGSPGVTATVIEGEPNDGCSSIANARGHIVLIRPRCYPDQIASYLQSVGAAGLILGLSEHWDSPPTPIDLDSPILSDMPTLVISEQDADLLSDALAQGTVNATIAGNLKQLIGADIKGRPYLNATDPVTTSMLSHWDMSVRPNLLMEPFTVATDDPHGLDLTLSVLRDIGWEAPSWQPSCGDGELDDGEMCDDGVFNSDTALGACRRDCTLPQCGAGLPASDPSCNEGCGCRLTNRRASPPTSLVVTAAVLMLWRSQRSRSARPRA